MADIDASLVSVGKPVEGGCVYVDFTPGTYPTDAATAMSTLSNYESAGEVSENGYTESRSLSTTDHKGWHGSVVLTSIDDDTKTYKIEFIEVARGTAAKLRYGAKNVTLNDDGSVKKIVDSTFSGDPISLVIDELESNGNLRRTVIKKAVVTSFDDVTHQRGSLMSYGMTFTVNDPDDGSEAIEIYRAKPSTN